MLRAFFIFFALIKYYVVIQVSEFVAYHCVLMTLAGVTAYICVYICMYMCIYIFVDFCAKPKKVLLCNTFVRKKKFF